MADGMLSLSDRFDEATEADWLAAVEKALKGGGIGRITRQTRDGIKIHPLYREPDFAAATDPRGAPGQAPYLRGASTQPDVYLPWDIRQSFSHPDPAETNAQIMRDLERGVTSIHLALECSGQRGCIITNLDQLSAALKGVRADIATVSLGHRGAGSGASGAALLALWADQQDDPKAQKLAFNISPIGQLLRTGKVAGGVDAAIAKTAALVGVLADKFPVATSLEVEAVSAHEAGASEAQELAVLIANAVDLMRRLDAAGLAPETTAQQLLFRLAVDANYGIGIAKLRAARRLWARVQEAMGLTPQPMLLHVTSSARMLTKYDAWVNILRGTAACFAGATGGADIVTVRAFNERFSVPEELGRRVARNTQIMAMEESGLGRVADPSGGAWFSETLAEDLAQAAWSEFQKIETEGGLVQSLIDGHLQARIAEKRAALEKDIARRKVPITGVSEFPLLEEIAAPVADVVSPPAGNGVDPIGLSTLLPSFESQAGDDTTAEPLTWISIAATFESLRDRAEAHLQSTGARPSIYFAELGSLAERTARVDFARNAFAAGGIEAKSPIAIAKGPNAVETQFSESGCRIAIICGSDKSYEAEAASVAKSLKDAGAAQVWLAGKYESEHVDRRIYMGADIAHEMTVALAELGVQ